MADDPKTWAALITGGLALVGSIYSACMAYLGKRKQSLLESSLRRIERTELSRSAGYGEIWTLTGCLNLFGPSSDLNSKETSEALKEWYFKHGLVLKKASKNRYFLVQEILNFSILREATFRRPSGELLYATSERPVQALRNLQSQHFRDKDGRTRPESLESYVNSWKSDFDNQTPTPETNWILLQFAMSSFRSGLIADLGLGTEDETSIE